MKPRRDITLGEMQDECTFRGENCETIGGERCEYYFICGKLGKPADWDLTDPPRFNEAQTAFFRGWYAMGAKFVRRWQDGCIWFTNEHGDDVGTIKHSFDLVDILEIGETLNLAEMFGKDAT